MTTIPAHAEDAQKNPETSSVTVQSCRPICAKGRETALSNEGEKLLYQTCFKKLMCVATRPSMPIARFQAPSSIIELWIHGTDGRV